MSSLVNLPVEVRQLILSQLALSDKAALIRTCKSLKAISTQVLYEKLDGLGR